MNQKLTRIAALGIALLVLPAPALAQPLPGVPDNAPGSGGTPAGAEAPGTEEPPAGEPDEAAESAAGKSLGILSLFLGGAGAFCAALISIGAAYGISKIGAAAVESMARQPEAANSIQAGMIVSAALIEGITFFGLIVCILAIYAG